MNRRKEVLISAWESFREGTGIPEAYMDSPCTDKDCQFYVGFNAAWDALLSEIRPLVAELQSYEALERQYYSPGSLLCRKHSVAVERLRELMREAGE